MKRIILIGIVFLLFSCSNEYWAVNVAKPGVGKVVERKKMWTGNIRCHTYPSVVIQKTSYVKRHHFYRHNFN